MTTLSPPSNEYVYINDTWDPHRRDATKINVSENNLKANHTETGLYSVQGSKPLGVHHEKKVYMIVSYHKPNGAELEYTSFGIAHRYNDPSSRSAW